MFFLRFSISSLNLVPYSSTCSGVCVRVSGNESGLSSSLAFTPVQGIELVRDLGQTSFLKGGSGIALGDLRCSGG